MGFHKLTTSSTGAEKNKAQKKIDDITRTIKKLEDWERDVGIRAIFYRENNCILNER